jgi:hypothetical protein
LGGYGPFLVPVGNVGGWLKILKVRKNIWTVNVSYSSKQACEKKLRAVI